MNCLLNKKLAHCVTLVNNIQNLNPNLKSFGAVFTGRMLKKTAQYRLISGHDEKKNKLFTSLNDIWDNKKICCAEEQAELSHILTIQEDNDKNLPGLLILSPIYASHISTISINNSNYPPITIQC